MRWTRAPADAGVIELETSAILGLLSRDEIETLARERLAPLLTAPDGADLRRVLETWLRHNAAWDPAARELGMHRHTLKAQVRRAGSLVRLDLDTFEAKAELWAMLTAAGGRPREVGRLVRRASSASTVRPTWTGRWIAASRVRSGG